MTFSASFLRHAKILALLLENRSHTGTATGTQNLTLSTVRYLVALLYNTVAATVVLLKCINTGTGTRYGYGAVRVPG